VDGVQKLITSKIQNVQNAAAHLITKMQLHTLSQRQAVLNTFEHVTPILKDIHWLQIQDPYSNIQWFSWTISCLH